MEHKSPEQNQADNKNKKKENWKQTLQRIEQRKLAAEKRRKKDKYTAWRDRCLCAVQERDCDR